MSAIPPPPKRSSSPPPMPPYDGSRLERTGPTPKPEPQLIESFPIREHSPVPLTASQEQQVRDIYYKRVRDMCANEIREFAQCATGRTFTIPFACRSQRLAMESCMVSKATREEEDRAREQWFETVGERRRQGEEAKRLNEEQKKKHHEWWGLDEHGRRKF